jgi:hypothetical protein
MERVLLVCEGVHDSAFLARLLRCLGFEAVRDSKTLDPGWLPLLPAPPRNRLVRAYPIPECFELPSADKTLIVLNAEGLTNIARLLSDRLGAMADAGETVDGIGLVVDADAEGPRSRLRSLARSSSDAEVPAWPIEPGSVATSSPRVGVFVFPDARSTGTFDLALLDCAASEYPALLAAASRHVQLLHAPPSELDATDLEEARKPAGRDKATVASMVALLKPGKAVQTSTQDHRWVSARTLELPRVAACLKFLAELTGVPVRSLAPVQVAP